MVENLDEQTREATVSSEELDQISKIIEQRLEKLSQILKVRRILKLIEI